MPPTQTGRKASSSARKIARTDEASKGLLNSLDSRTVNSITAIPLGKRNRICKPPPLKSTTTERIQKDTT